MISCNILWFCSSIFVIGAESPGESLIEYMTVYVPVVFKASSVLASQVASAFDSAFSFE